MDATELARVLDERGIVLAAPHLLSKCVSMCTACMLDCEEFAAQLESLLLSRAGNEKVSASALDELQSSLNSKAATKKRSAAAAPSSATPLKFNKPSAHLLPGFGSPAMEHGPATAMPLPPKIIRVVSPDAASAPPPTSSTSLNPHLPLPPRSGSREPVLVSPLPPGVDRNLSGPYKWMFSTPAGRVDALDARLTELEQAFIANFKPALEKGELPPLVPVGMVSAGPVTCIGRICCDSESESGVRLKASSVLLEGSRRASNGARVRLDVEGLPGFCLFPGQIVGVIGTNSLGHTMKAHKLLPAFPPPHPDSVLEAGAPGRRECEDGRTGSCVWAAHGPFTTHDDMSFDPLAELLSEATQSEHGPDVLVLLGPFVDAGNPSVASGDVMVQDESNVMCPLTFSEIMELKLVPILEAYLGAEYGGSKSLTVVIVPSTDDVLGFPAFPQPPYATKMFAALPQHVLNRVVLVSNPSMFVVNNIIFGASSADALATLSNEEASKAPPGVRVERLTMLAQQLLEQRSFFPVFPSGPIPLELTQLHHTGMPVHPDVLFVCSKLAGMAKAIGPCVFVNPGKLTMPHSKGTFAVVNVCASPTPPTPESPPAVFSTRTRVDIRRL